MVTRYMGVAALTIAAVICWASPSQAQMCGSDCSDQYQSDLQDCQMSYGDDPADADSLDMCTQNAQDDYQDCTEECMQNLGNQ